MKFKVGDRVKCLGKHHSNSPDLNPIAGTKGVVIEVDNSDGQFPVRVNWDNGVLTWAFGDDVVSVLPAHKIVITTDGVTTLARLYDGKKVVKSAEAKCHPNDEFDFEMGASVAFERLWDSAFCGKQLETGTLTDYKSPYTAKREKPETPTPKYKVGDKVRVVGNTRPRHAVEIGSVEKIAWLNERTVMLHTDDTKRAWRIQYVSKSDIEPYTEPEQEPIKLYCVKDYIPGEWLTKNKIYDVSGGNITFDQGPILPYVASAFLGGSPISNYFVPLVKRPAKVGEWVYITDNAIGTARRHKGKIVKITSIKDRGYSFFNPDDNPAYDANLELKEYLVLDGYQPEPEYLNCEVICTDDGGFPEYWKVGYKYRFENGSLRFPDGEKVGKFTSLEKANETIGARFILYRGEA